jgi:hypothetical protein
LQTVKQSVGASDRAVLRTSKNVNPSTVNGLKVSASFPFSSLITQTSPLLLSWTLPTVPDRLTPTTPLTIIMVSFEDIPKEAEPVSSQATENASDEWDELMGRELLMKVRPCMNPS